MNKALLISAGLALALVLLAAACGDDDDQPSSDDSAAGESDGSFAGGGEAIVEQPVEGEVAEEEAAADEAAPPSEAEASSSPAAIGSLDRKIIESATVELEVEDVIRGFTAATRIATEGGGFVASSNVHSEDDQRFATLTIRVPADEYASTLERLRGLGEVVSEGSNASDVTEEYTDLQSRLRNLQAVEAQYVQLLAQATNINDVLVVQDRLNITRADIEQIQGRINVLDDLTALASIDVFLSPPAVAAEEPSEGWRLFAPAEEALENSYDALKQVAAGAIAAGIYGLWILPLAAVGYVVARFVARRQAAQSSG
jgi:hypothetical protein